MGRAGEAEVQQRHQRLAAGQHLRLVTVAVEQPGGLIDVARPVQAEVDGFHLRDTASHTSCGVTGSDSNRPAPTADSASLTAEHTAAGAPIYPDSPAPFCPIEVSGDDVQCSAIS